MVDRETGSDAMSGMVVRSKEVAIFTTTVKDETLGHIELQKPSEQITPIFVWKTIMGDEKRDVENFKNELGKSKFVLLLFRQA